MEIGILGLARSGKTTVFNLMTGNSGDTGRERREPSRGIARVPDVRLDELTKLYRPRKQTYATVQYVDMPGALEEHRRDNATVNVELRAADALIAVIRAFANPAVEHPLLTVDPLRDLNQLEEELLLQDQLVVEKRLERLERGKNKQPSAELAAELALLTRCLEALENEQPLRDLELSPAEAKTLRGFTFLSLKPLLVVLNIDEKDIGKDLFSGEFWQQWRDRQGVALTSVCATLEGELAMMEPDERELFMAEYGVTEPALDRVIRESYRLVGLISFFTVGEDECRAWSIRVGTQAVDAAAVIHSDIQRGFIRAEVVPHEELLAANSLAACRERGSLRLEGKGYTVIDGDVVHYRFNV